MNKSDAAEKKDRFERLEESAGIGKEPGTDIMEIPLTELHEFNGHPFRVLDDGKMEELVDSIQENGVLVPGIARPRAEGGYEIVSGHRRKRACELAGFTKMPMFVKNLTDEDAILEMVDSNIQRENISHSEKAKAYQMRYNAMKGKNPGVNSLNQLAAATGENKKQIQRYVWLARLTDDLLRMVDEKRLPFIHGVNLSFLKEKEQNWVYDQLKDRKGSISAKQTELLKIMSQTRELTKDEVKNILSMEQVAGKKKRMVRFDETVCKEYFDDDCSEEDITEKKRVWHPEVTKEVWVVDVPAYTETITYTDYIDCYLCPNCGATFATYDEADQHLMDSVNRYLQGEIDYYSICVNFRTWQTPVERTENFEHPEEGHWETVVVSEGYWE